MSLEHNSYGSNYDELVDAISKETKTERDKEPDYTLEPTKAEKTLYRRAWVAVAICCICYVISFLSLTPVSVQFFSYRIAKDKYHITYNDTSNFKCGNASTKLENLIDRVQKEASQIMLENGLATGIPACFTCLLVGSYSDYLGRRPILMASISGGFLRLLLLTFIVKFEWNIRLYYIGAVVDGLLGTYFTLILATSAVIADITPIAKNRALNFAVIEGLMFPTAAAAQIGIGYLIRDESFFLPVTLLCGLQVIAFFVVVFFLPETVQWKRAVTWNPKVHIKKVVGFYFLKDSKQKQRLYILGLFAFVLVALTNIGRQSVETLFELNYPVCWDSVQIGTYTAIRMVGTAIVTVSFLRLMKNHLSLEFTGVLCAVSGIASFVIFGLSESSAGLYLAAIVGALYLGCLPIPRALLSQLAPVTEQGALFSGLSVVDTLCSLVSSTAFTFIYNNTLNSFKGAVFMVIACFTFMNAVILVAFRFTRADSTLLDYTVIVERDVKVPHGSIAKSPNHAVDESSSIVVK